MPLDVLNIIRPASAAECEESSLLHPFQPPASSRARLSGSFLVEPLHLRFDVSPESMDQGSLPKPDIPLCTSYSRNSGTFDASQVASLM
jgi:hypothetical protein